MAQRAKPSGIILDETDAAIAKGMISRGDRQHDIAAWFGVNGGRIGEIASSITVVVSCGDGPVERRLGRLFAIRTMR